MMDSAIVTTIFEELTASVSFSAAAFVMAYPFVTCLLWSFSAIYYVAARARTPKTGRAAASPSYSVLIPFYAEPDGAIATANSLRFVSPAPQKIFIIDDGSPFSIPHDVALPENTEVLKLARNSGKSEALQAALPRIKSDVVVCMDADTINVTANWRGLLSRFHDHELGAVTGKIRPAGGGGFVEAFQALDYLTVISVIKAAESSWGGLLTVSGALAAYRTKALRSVGGWSNATSTEDIDVSWRLQSSGWQLAYESDWTAQVEMAPNVKALWRQRRRWSAGLGRVLRDHLLGAVLSGARHLPIVVLAMVSIGWLTSMLLLLVQLGIASATGTQAVLGLPYERVGLFLVAGLCAFYFQLGTALAVDKRRLGAHWRSLLIAPLYPAYFWLILVTSFLGGFPKGLFRLDAGNWKRTLRRVEAARQ